MENIKEVLESLISSIENIDGGCTSCIDEFCCSANTELKAFGFKYIMPDEDKNEVVLESVYP